MNLNYDYIIARRPLSIGKYIFSMGHQMAQIDSSFVLLRMQNTITTTTTRTIFKYSSDYVVLVGDCVLKSGLIKRQKNSFDRGVGQIFYIYSSVLKKVKKTKLLWWDDIYPHTSSVKSLRLLYYKKLATWNLWKSKKKFKKKIRAFE